VALVDEVPDGVRVEVHITGREALVRAVEKHGVPFRLDRVTELAPLRLYVQEYVI
jgi:hypothetical protein